MVCRYVGSLTIEMLYLETLLGGNREYLVRIGTWECRLETPGDLYSPRSEQAYSEVAQWACLVCAQKGPLDLSYQILRERMLSGAYKVRKPSRSTREVALPRMSAVAGILAAVILPLSAVAVALTH